ncbi:hypothetical protein [Spartinivicinus poritis]|uniref:Uncharacterized protein n=1 Tax=Spartinivicinus poritis TaxID=2994640 RepID=A0ABT5U7J0_9GAMM|nr:hypothetical protein [Spartinivicinus sp. A2-2]MDE1462165.1 hypothetical protein [Spartinivicinus sp. A2-2]
MNRTTYYQFDATLNHDGTYTCDSVTEVTEEQETIESNDKTTFNRFQKQNSQTTYNPFFISQVFNQTYEQNCKAEKNKDLDQLVQNLYKMSQTILNNTFNSSTN